MISLTPEQSKLFNFIAATIHETGGVAPTFVQMAQHLGLSAKSKGSIHRQIKILEEKGYIRRFPRRARSIELKKVATDFKCPSCGYRTSNSHGSLPVSPSLKAPLGALKTGDDVVDALELGSAG